MSLMITQGNKVKVSGDSEVRPVPIGDTRKPWTGKTSERVKCESIASDKAELEVDLVIQNRQHDNDGMTRTYACYEQNCRLRRSVNWHRGKCHLQRFVH